MIDEKDLIKFLINRKMTLLDSERRANGRAKISLTSQIQVIETILIELNQQNKSEGIDMEKINLALDKQARSLEDLKPRSRNSGLTDAIIELAESLNPGTYRQISTEKVKGKSIIAKIYTLKKTGKLPMNIIPITRGAEIFIANKK